MYIKKLRKALAIACIAFSPTILIQQAAFATQTQTIYQPSSTASSELSLDELTSGIERYMVSTNSGLRFSSKAAQAAGEPNQIIEAGNNFNRIQQAQLLNGNVSSTLNSVPSSLAANPQMQLQAINLPVWGNWCGPGYSGPGAPIDILDSICMQHDKCYEQRGYFSCYCDDVLKAEINRLASQMGTRERIMAAAIKLAFSYPICSLFS